LLNLHVGCHGWTSKNNRKKEMGQGICDDPIPLQICFSHFICLLCQSSITSICMLILILQIFCNLLHSSQHILLVTLVFIVPIYNLNIKQQKIVSISVITCLIKKAKNPQNKFEEVAIVIKSKSNGFPSQPIFKITTSITTTISLYNFDQLIFLWEFSLLNLIVFSFRSFFAT
ncbi:hypothetical protein ACJX0J_039789, partial [Zea mays]